MKKVSNGSWISRYGQKGHVAEDEEAVVTREGRDPTTMALW